MLGQATLHPIEDNTLTNPGEKPAGVDGFVLSADSDIFCERFKANDEEASHE